MNAMVGGAAGILMALSVIALTVWFINDEFKLNMSSNQKVGLILLMSVVCLFWFAVAWFFIQLY